MSKQPNKRAIASEASNNLSTPVSPPATEVSPISKPESSASAEAREQRIQVAAYQRYEMRGYEPGHDVEDWLAAEAEIVEPSLATQPAQVDLGGPGP